MSAVPASEPMPLPPGPIHGPAAWKGPEIDRDRGWLHQLTGDDLEELDAAIRAHFAEGREMGSISTIGLRSDNYCLLLHI